MHRTTKPHKSIISIILFILLLFTTLNAHSETKETIKIGILAKRGIPQTMQQWQPLAEYLDQQIPTYTFKIVPLGFKDLNDAVAHNSVDFVLTNTFQYVAFEYHYGASRIATLQNHSDKGPGQQRFGGVIFTRSDNTSIHTLEDTRHKRFAAVDPESFGGWIMGKKELLDHGVSEKDFSKLLFLHSHDAVVHAVLEGRVDAGTIRSDTLERMASEGKISMNQVRVIAPKSYSGFPFATSTALYPEWPFSKLSHTSDELAESVLIALLGIEPQFDVAKRTKTDHWTIPMDYSPVHDLLKTLNMPPYDAEITLTEVVKKYAVEIILAILIILVLSVIVVFILFLYRQLQKQSARIATLNGELTKQMEREHIFRQMLDSQTALTMLGDETRIVECNESFLNFFGVLSSDEIIHHGLCSYFIDETHNDREHSCLSTIFAMQQQGVYSKITMLDQNGYPRVFHAHIDRFAHDASLFVVNLVDITSSEELHQKLVLLQKAVNQSSNTILISTVDGVVEYVNNSFCECCGHEESELVGHNAELLNTIGLNPLASKDLYNTLSENKVWIGEVQKQHKDGSEHIIRMAISPIKDVNGTITHLIAIGEDVSKYRTIENTLKEKEKMLLAQSRLVAVGEMLSMIAQQWRQPLSIIQMCLNNLEFTLQLMELEEQESIKTMTEQVEFLSNTIDNFSNCFKNDTQIETNELDTIICNAVQLLEKDLENNHITLQKECNIEMQINTRQQDVIQVLINLITNAKDVLIHRNVASAKITLRTNYLEENGLFVVEIIDNGGGVNETIKDRIFEPYFSTKEVQEGSGLGLYIAKAIVENNLHGSIGFEATTDGTCFYIKIPSLLLEQEEQKLKQEEVDIQGIDFEKIDF
ncbi:MAG: PhnD/SsuA/transferrin family substrate-binding protein [Sulfuricurvum sp.]|uniref:PhnD/SsuA/transferrin family substrate-binding protein n=1 Tax=Sulfuricurvum sp. TaxID=2025608 RepID=UPI00261AAD42|nr:PhnD/SsuA/transferrin family substrate-binding protein [Sulfuricurvum sp.]MDD2830136.1 PhnD/SsuA/transferrin family substrate-binding protein [Sulfuricurvum sp.]MDD4950109.1 PhnD/SsuA/transferrin family substrate-binding protein [Sulfuricurvum sp.]